MADNDFRVTMIDQNGGEFVAGSPEVVARLTSQGYRQKAEESEATGDEQAATNVPADVETSGSKPDFESVGKPAATAPKPGGKASGSK